MTIMGTSALPDVREHMALVFAGQRYRFKARRAVYAHERSASARSATGSS